MINQAFNPDSMANPVGPYSQVVSAPPGGRLVFCAGAVALDSDGNIVGKGDIVAQTRQVMENLRLGLEAADATFADVVKITNYVLDAQEWKRVLPVRAEYIKEPYPASSFLEVRALMFPELLIEIEAIAVTFD
jgi:reactive intermediate/imine deaminase